jgi:ABC-type Mn2+/Zn2+ transport system permease subunit
MIGSAWHWLSEPWTVSLVRRAFVEVLLLAVAGGTLGCWVLFWDLAYGAESLSHAMFPGLVVAALAGGSLLVGGAGGVAVAALAVAAVSQARRVARDTAFAVVISALFGLGVLLALSPASPPGVETLLFGNLLGLSTTDLLEAAGLAAGIVFALRGLHGRLLAVGFDRAGASALGASPALTDVGLLVLLAAAVVVSVQAVGNLLTPAVLIGPAAAARLLARRMVAMMGIAVAIGIVAGMIGLYVSFYGGTAAGASVAGAVVLAYLVTRGVVRFLPSRRPHDSVDMAAPRPTGLLAVGRVAVER